MPEPCHQMFVYLIRCGRSSMVWLQDIAPSEFTRFDDHEQSNLSSRFVQFDLCNRYFPFPPLPCSIKHVGGRERGDSQSLWYSVAWQPWWTSSKLKVRSPYKTCIRDVCVCGSVCMCTNVISAFLPSTNQVPWDSEATSCSMYSLACWFLKTSLKLHTVQTKMLPI